ncbi:Hsp70-binding protein 1 [Amphibalanus amphitrite]|uniref:Hsp70-binding protein 1 n=1 Tax=Amphibalanus amphitrite TaxID=1232801 RepID=A0A6A4WBI7_AMPAM|nr:hsp70-binding protein 1-like [Amphibalanus amphitrite]KAF0302559.1 Hsp70-binding protein 1 [Amphibalanus amphitrite]
MSSNEGAPADGSGSGDGRRDQVRDMQGLLRLSIQHGTAEPADPGAPMDDERRQFLAAAMHHASSAIADALRTALAALAETDTERQLAALRVLRDHVDQVDVANDFEKMGGLAAVQPLLASADGEIRAEAAGVLGDMVQNNPQCQRAALAAGLLPQLLKVVQADPEPVPRVTALQAVSGLLRHYPPAQAVFCAQDGCTALVSAMQSGQPRMQTKAAFLLGTVCSESGELRRRALDVGLIEQVCGLLAAPHQSWHEHLLAALTVLAADGGRAAAECRRPELRLAQLLTVREQELKGLDEALEVLEHCRTLRQLCFSAEDEGER